MTSVRGILPALVTPFDSQGKLDKAALGPLVDMLIERGVGGFFVCGTTGESFLLSMRERMETLEAAMQAVAGRLPVIAHTGCLRIEDTVLLGRHAREAGAAGAAAVAPFYFKYPFEGHLEYFRRAAGEAEIPFYLYNFPDLTHVEFTAGELRELLSLPGMAGLKNTTTDLKPLAAAAGMGLTALCGHDQMLLGALAMGAAGGIGSNYNLTPERFVRLQSLYGEGRMGEAQALQREINGICAIINANGGLPAVKYALSCMGLPCGEARLPFRPPGEESRQRIREMVKKHLAPAG